MRAGRIWGIVILCACILGGDAAGAELPSHMIQLVPAIHESEEADPAYEAGGRAEASLISDTDGGTVESWVSEPGESGEDSLSLYALSAVLMDGDTGRVLYSREGDTPRPMASTTKVMTCILALENSSGNDCVTVSAKAAAQPDVQLNIQEGEQYYMKDLLYSLMLKSHNDVAVAVAEHVGGSVEGFAEMMNRKAAELGCTDTHFVTPNGLDAEDAGGVHHTTARDLALIMRYAIQNEDFLRITQTRDYSFSDITGTRQFSVQNGNALLDMAQGVLSGKTGFTGNAGYCYVCACEREGKTFIIALLGCGWPSNKTYKWKDTITLLNYGNSHFHYENLWREPQLKKVEVKEGVTADSSLEEKISLEGAYRVPEDKKSRQILLGEQEEIRVEVSMPDAIPAPVVKGEQIGEISCILGDEVLYSCPILAEKTVWKRTYAWCVNRVFHDFFH